MLSSRKSTTVALGLAVAIVSATVVPASAAPLQKQQAPQVNPQMTHQANHGNIPGQLVQPLPCQHSKRLYQETDDIEDWRSFQTCMRQSFK